MRKKERQEWIRQMIEEHSVETQDELLELLTSKGANVTQATISRDIREMRIVKARDGDGVIRYTIFKQPQISDEKKLQASIRESMDRITQIKFMNVMHTTLGTANVIAALIDELDFLEVEGTMAGTDTIIIISQTEAEAKIIHDKLESYL